MNLEEYLVVFSGHNISTYLYQRLVIRSLYVELVPTPAKIHYGCSLAVKFRANDMSIVLEEIRKMNTAPKGIFKIIKDGKQLFYEKVN